MPQIGKVLCNSIGNISQNTILPFDGILRTSGIVISNNLTHYSTCVCTSWHPILVKEESLGCLGSLKLLCRCRGIVRSTIAPAWVIQRHGSEILNCNVTSIMPCCTTLPKQSKSTINTFVLGSWMWHNKGLEQIYFWKEGTNHLSHSLTLEVSIINGTPATPLWMTRAVSAPRILWLYALIPPAPSIDTGPGFAVKVSPLCSH